MSEAESTAGPYAGHTAWARSLERPLREFLNTETGSAAVLLAATVAALVWVNLDAGSYRSVWEAEVAIRVSGHEIAMDVRGWVNSGLMTFFFFVVGLEARREFDMGELRERRRVVLPVVAGVGGMVNQSATTPHRYLGHVRGHGFDRARIAHSEPAMRNGPYGT